MNALNHRTVVAAERRERMRARLLSSALDLVAHRGPAATSIDDVIAAADVSRGTFYRYFDSPQTMVRELALAITNELIAIAESVVQLHTDPAERVACGVRVVTRLAVSHPAVAGFLVRLAWADVGEQELMLAFAKRDLQEGLRRRRFLRMPIQLALNIVAGTTLGAVQSLLQPGCPADFAEQAAASALRALGLDDREAQRIAKLKMPAPRLLDGGLIALASAAQPTPIGKIVAAKRDN